jgi:hypothetical protein
MEFIGIRQNFQNFIQFCLLLQSIYEVYVVNIEEYYNTVKINIYI